MDLYKEYPAHIVFMRRNSNVAVFLSLGIRGPLGDFSGSHTEVFKYTSAS